MYLCEAALWALMAMQSKYQSTLKNAEDALGPAVSTIWQDFIIVNFYLCVCMYVWVSVRSVSAGVDGSQQGVSEPLELELWHMDAGN